MTTVITKPVSFREIFENSEWLEGQKFNCIEIPIIQRDYAQGRTSDSVNRIRKQFLEVLYDAVNGIDGPVVLDFVYGNIEHNKLIPLDGQQRLTTLYLLHWYAVKKDKIEDNSWLNSFNYRIRFTSQHFIECIATCDPDFSEANLSDWIKDQHWFMYNWEYDPTIKSMLVMLDDIHKLFGKVDDLWTKLVSHEKDPITFYFLSLEDMGLTDSLYIKMNSRGKPLTQFEHFKAYFEKIIKGTDKALFESFVLKIDNEWVDMFWKYRGDDFSIDDEFMRYYRFVTDIICLSTGCLKSDNDFDTAEIVYGINNENAKDNLQTLFAFMDCWLEYESIHNLFENNFSSKTYCEGKVVLFENEINLFKLCCDIYGEYEGIRRKFSIKNTLILYGVVLYISNTGTIRENEFKERIRIIRNLIENSDDEIRELRMPELIKDVTSIILTGNILTGTSGLNELQKQEEILKKDWRIDNYDLVSTLNSLEDHEILRGCVSIVDFTDIGKCKLRSKKFNEIFTSDIDLLNLSRALLCIGDYTQFLKWRYLFGNEQLETWRELFTPSRNREGFEDTKRIILKFIDNYEEDINQYINLARSEYLVNQKIYDWKYYIIKYDTMRFGKSGIYYWPGPNYRKENSPYLFYMMNTPKSTGGRNWDPFLFEVSKDPKYAEKVFLDEYKSPLIINKTKERIISENTGFKIQDIDGQIIKHISISQEIGLDTQDRVAVLKEYIDSLN
jgi:hypothetical protein